MANKLYDDTSIKAIADAIRSKNGKTDTYTVAEMAGAINDIPAGAVLSKSNGISALKHREILSIM